jgi:hypothetical protein
MTIPVAFPFVEVLIDTSGLLPVAQRSPGVIAVVGKAADGAAAFNVPTAVNTIDDVNTLFAAVAGGVVQDSELSKSLKLAMLQNPKPAKIYGVRVEADNYIAALSSLEAADDVTFVSLANETQVDDNNLLALKTHCENMSANGQKRIGVAMVDPNVEKSPTYATDILATVDAAKSSVSRMIMVAARGTSQDVATAAMAAIAGFAPHISVVLKKIVGITIPTEKQYSPSEIIALSEGNVIPIIDPALIVGESLHFAEGRLFTTDASQLYIDIVRTLDDIDFRLQAGLIGSVGNARITKFGMTSLKGRIEGILGPLKRQQVIADFAVDIPVLNVLQLPESARNSADTEIITQARANRIVDVFVTVTYGPAVHRLKVNLALKF